MIGVARGSERRLRCYWWCKPLAATIVSKWLDIVERISLLDFRSLLRLRCLGNKDRPEKSRVSPIVGVDSLSQYCDDL